MRGFRQSKYSSGLSRFLFYRHNSGSRREAPRGDFSHHLWAPCFVFFVGCMFTLPVEFVCLPNRRTCYLDF